MTSLGNDAQAFRRFPGSGNGGFLLFRGHHDGRVRRYGPQSLRHLPDAERGGPQRSARVEGNIPGCKVLETSRSPTLRAGLRTAMVW